MPNTQFFEKKGPFQLKDIAKTIGCTSEISKKENFKVYGVESLVNAKDKDMTFLNSIKYKDLSIKTEAAACITTSNLLNFLPKNCIKLNVKNVLFALTQVSRLFYPNADIDNPDKHLSLSDNLLELYPNVNFGKNVLIGKSVTIKKNTSIGSNSIIESNVEIGENCVIGSFVTIRKSLIANKPLVRVSNNGISAIIDQDGNIIKSSKLNQISNIGYKIKINNKKNFFHIHSYLKYYIFFIFLIFIIFNRQIYSHE